MSKKKQLQVLLIPALTALYHRPAFAAFDQGAGAGAGSAKPKETPSDLFTGTNAVFQTIANILIFLTGAIAVIMLIYGGLRYVTSGGNASSTKAAKDTILYGIIGLVVAILAFAIVNFVVSSLKP